MIDLNKPCEGIDYEIVPFDKADHEQAWQVLMLRGPYAHYNLVFTEIEYNGKINSLRFKLDAIHNDELIETDKQLQDYSFDLLTDILKNGIADGSLMFNDKNTDN